MKELTREEKLELRLKYPCPLCALAFGPRCRDCLKKIAELEKIPLDLETIKSE